MRFCSSVVRVYMYFKNYKNLKIYERKLIQKERTNYIKLSTFNRNIYQSTYQTLLIVTTISTNTGQVTVLLQSADLVGCR